MLTWCHGNYYIPVLYIPLPLTNLCCCAADCEESTAQVNTTIPSATTAAVSDNATAVITHPAADDDDLNRERFRLHVSPRPNDDGQLMRAVGSSVVFTCQRVSVRDDDDDRRHVEEKEVAPDATRIEWFDKNDIVIPSQTSHR